MQPKRWFIARSAAGKGLGIRRIWRNLRITLECDPARVTQILINLLNNAIKYTKTGGITVHATTRRAGSGARWAAIRVSDTGVGVAVQDHERIFHEFERRNTTGGIGIGLAISRRLAKRLGGGR